MSAQHGVSAPPGVLGLLDGRPLPRAELDRRLLTLRQGPRASALPAPGSAEDRQLTRWVAQVLLTEELCRAEATARGLDCAATPPVRLDQRAAVELGSIAAAAYEGSAAVRAVFAAVTAEVGPTTAETTAYLAALAATRRQPSTRWQLSTPDGDFEADPATLPADLAAALRSAPPGESVTVGAWTATLLDPHPDPVPDSAPVPVSDSADPAEHLRGCAQRIAFVRWLDRARAERLTLVPGLEHPGDPAQPDNHHRH
ncbi:[acyl-carrier-protein] S-malonyltransferase [Kitasatospora sp. MAP12-15]|uniref:DUF7158 domain-containing protein n=1 Tax=unclassified Kitasatospora TaxID=2633591 RepID=UPI002474573B|nr:hypothetical protein [Kitasatospora sp. MAP12-44]MDH6114844.1 [acyl-carrier-protein] S-malonyltransferase [Kitasatospora sp. MAP12-44]